MFETIDFEKDEQWVLGVHKTMMEHFHSAHFPGRDEYPLFKILIINYKKTSLTDEQSIWLTVSYDMCKRDNS